MNILNLREAQVRFENRFEEIINKIKTNIILFIF